MTRCPCPVPGHSATSRCWRPEVPRSRCPRGWFLEGTLPLALDGRRLSVLTQPFLSLYGCQSSGIWAPPDLTFMTSFKAHLQIQSHWGCRLGHTNFRGTQSGLEQCEKFPHWVSPAPGWSLAHPMGWGVLPKRLDCSPTTELPHKEGPGGPHPQPVSGHFLSFPYPV